MMRRGVISTLSFSSSKASGLIRGSAPLFSELQDSLASCISFISQRDGISFIGQSHWYVPCVAGYSFFGNEIFLQWIK